MLYKQIIMSCDDITCIDIVQNYNEKWLKEHPEIESDFVQKLSSLFSSLDEENIPYNQYARYKSPAASSSNVLQKRIAKWYGTSVNGFMPLYRVAGNMDDSPYSQNGKSIQGFEATEMPSFLKEFIHSIDPDLNHCVVTKYRDESDSIGQHQDKNIDMNCRYAYNRDSELEHHELDCKESDIYIFSIGDTRKFALYTSDESTPFCTLDLKHGSLFRLTTRFNGCFKHSIIPERFVKRSERISIVARKMQTYYHIRLPIIAPYYIRYQKHYDSIVEDEYKSPYKIAQRCLIAEYANSIYTENGEAAILYLDNTAGDATRYFANFCNPEVQLYPCNFQLNKIQKLVVDHPRDFPNATRVKFPIEESSYGSLLLENNIDGIWQSPSMQKLRGSFDIIWLDYMARDKAHQLFISPAKFLRPRKESLLAINLSLHADKDNEVVSSLQSSLTNGLKMNVRSVTKYPNEAGTAFRMCFVVSALGDNVGTWVNRLDTVNHADKLGQRLLIPQPVIETLFNDTKGGNRKAIPKAVCAWYVWVRDPHGIKRYFTSPRTLTEDSTYYKYFLLARVSSITLSGVKLEFLKPSGVWGTYPNSDTYQGQLLANKEFSTDNVVEYREYYKLWTIHIGIHKSQTALISLVLQDNVDMLLQNRHPCSVSNTPRTSPTLSIQNESVETPDRISVDESSEVESETSANILVGNFVGFREDFLETSAEIRGQETRGTSKRPEVWIQLYFEDTGLLKWFKKDDPRIVYSVSEPISSQTQSDDIIETSLDVQPPLSLSRRKRTRDDDYRVEILRDVFSGNDRSRDEAIARYNSNRQKYASEKEFQKLIMDITKSASRLESRGWSSQMKANILKAVYRGLKNNECPICLEPFQNEDFVVALDCDHVLHKDCFQTYVSSGSINQPDKLQKDMKKYERLYTQTGDYEYRKKYNQLVPSAIGIKYHKLSVACPVCDGENNKVLKHSSEVKLSQEDAELLKEAGINDPDTWLSRRIPQRKTTQRLKYIDIVNDSLTQYEKFRQVLVGMNYTKLDFVVDKILNTFTKMGYEDVTHIFSEHIDEAIRRYAEFKLSRRVPDSLQMYDLSNIILIAFRQLLHFRDNGNDQKSLKLWIENVVEPYQGSTPEMETKSEFYDYIVMLWVLLENNPRPLRRFLEEEGVFSHGVGFESDGIEFHVNNNIFKAREALDKIITNAEPSSSTAHTASSDAQSNSSITHQKKKEESSVLSKRKMCTTPGCTQHDGHLGPHDVEVGSKRRAKLEARTSMLLQQQKQYKVLMDGDEENGKESRKRDYEGDEELDDEHAEKNKSIDDHLMTEDADKTGSPNDSTQNSMQTLVDALQKYKQMTWDERKRHCKNNRKDLKVPSNDDLEAYTKIFPLIYDGKQTNRGEKLLALIKKNAFSASSPVYPCDAQELGSKSSIGKPSDYVSDAVRFEEYMVEKNKIQSEESPLYEISDNPIYKDYKEAACSTLQARAHPRGERALDLRYSDIDALFRKRYPLILAPHIHGSKKRVFAYVDLTSNETKIYNAQGRIGPEGTKSLGTYCDMRTAALAHSIFVHTGITDIREMHQTILRHKKLNESDQTYIMTKSGSDVKTKEKTDRKLKQKSESNGCGKARFESATYENVIFEHPDLITYDTDSTKNVYAITNKQNQTHFRVASIRGSSIDYGTFCDERLARMIAQYARTHDMTREEIWRDFGLL